MKIEHLSQSKDSSTERPIRRGIFDHDPINIDEDIVKLTIPERSIKGGSKRKRVERALRKSITDWQNTTTLAMLRPDMLSSLGNTIQESVLKVFDIYKELHTNHVSESKNFESPDTNAMWITRPLTDCALAPITLIGDREGFVLSPHVLNPVSYAIISEIYNDLPRFFQLSGENVNHIDEIIALGYLFGKFDPSNPNAEYYIQVLKSLRVRPENTKLFGSIIRIDDDKERVKPARVEALLKLKKFWPDVFAYYWQSSRHLNQFSSAQPLSQQTLTEAGVKGTPPLSDLFPIEDHDNGRSPRAESITQATFQQRRSTLQKSIGSFLSAYTGSKVSYEVIRHSMSKELSHQILKSLIVQLSNKSPEDITHEVLFQISAELQATIHRYNPAFFDITLPRHKFSLLAPIEQICIVAFTSFLHNGDASLKGNTESIKIIDQLLIPILNRHTATNLDVIHIKEPDLQDPNFDTTVQVELDKAKKRLSSLNIADHGLTSTQHPDIEKHIANQESLFLNMFGPLSNTLPEGYRKTAFGSFALSAGMLGIAFLASVATSVQSIYLTEGINASTPVIIGGLITALSSTSLYKYFHAVNTRKRLTYSTYNPIDTPDDEIKELRKDLKKIESRILLDSIRVSLATIVVLAGAMRAAKSLDTFIRSIDTVTSTDSDLNNAEKSGIGNHERAPGTGRATFFVYGQKDNGFWIDHACEPTATSMNCYRAAEYEKESLESILLPRNEFQIFIKKQLGAGNLVRFNTDPSDTYFQIREGYIPILVASDEPVVSARWHPTNGVDVLTASKSYFTAIVYEPLQHANAIPTGVFENDPLNIEVFREEVLDALIHQPEKDLIADIRVRYQSGEDIFTLLSAIKQHIEDIGISYGFEKFESGNLETDKLFALLTARNADGSVVNDEMICNQMSFITYMIAKQAGLPVKLASGYASSSESRWGGYNSTSHMLVLYKENEQWFPFEATLPAEQDADFEYPSIPENNSDFLEYSTQKERVTKAMQGALFTGAGLLLWNKGIQPTRKRLRKYQSKKRQEKITEMLALQAKVSDGARISAWYTLLAVLGCTDVIPNIEKPVRYKENWYTFATGKLEPSRENAALLADYLVQLAVTGKSAGASVEETQKKLSALTHDLLQGKIKQIDASRPRLLAAMVRKWLEPTLETSEHKERVQLHLLWVVTEVRSAEKRYEKKHRKRLTEKEKRQIDDAKNIVERLILISDSVGAEGFEPPTSSM